MDIPEIGTGLYIPTFIYAIIFAGAIAEEIGWRGYGLRYLQQKYTPFVASIYIGIVWSVWHKGYFLIIEKHAVSQMPGIVVFTMISAFYCTWLYNKTNGNILILILLHASVSFATLFVPNPSELFVLHITVLIRIAAWM